MKNENNISVRTRNINIVQKIETRIKYMVVFVAFINLALYVMDNDAPVIRTLFSVLCISWVLIMVVLYFMTEKYVILPPEPDNDI